MRRSAEIFCVERVGWNWRISYNLDDWSLGIHFSWLGRGMQGVHLLCFSLVQFNRTLLQEQFDKAKASWR